MIVCPNCSHENPDGATHCDACYTPLPVVTTVSCPNCGTLVQSDASFCGNCGFNLRSAPPAQSPMLEPDTLSTAPEEIALPVEMPELNHDLELEEIPEIISSEALSASATHPKTQLQVFKASLLHIQTNINLELPTNLQVIHLGKPNNMIPPDIDVSGFPDSDIVSRVHADIRYEGDAFYFEDTGSSNGTYINNTPLPAGNRHRLRSGDRISLGKGDKVSFVFQMT
jgi:hypothetical protein